MKTHPLDCKIGIQIDGSKLRLDVFFKQLILFKWFCWNFAAKIIIYCVLHLGAIQIICDTKWGEDHAAKCHVNFFILWF